MVDGTGLENRRAATYRGFESHSLRQENNYGGNNDKEVSLCIMGLGWVFSTDIRVTHGCLFENVCGVQCASPPPEEIAKHVFGQYEGVARLGVKEDDVEDFYLKYRRRVAEGFAATPLYEGAREVLDYLKNTSEMFIVTSSPRKVMTGAIEYHGLGNYFREIVTGDEVSAWKPDPEGVNYLLEKHGFGRDEAVIIGDSKSDLGVARNAGIDSVLVFPDDHVLFYDQESLIREYAPTYVVKSLSELIR